jgi:hypothetical protein
LLIFLTFLASLVGCSIWGASQGDGKIAAPYDKHGKFCGYDEREAFPNLYWPTISGVPKTVLNGGVCVKKCPAKTGDPVEIFNEETKSSGRGHFDMMNFCIPSGLSESEKADWTKLYNALFQDPSMSWLKSMHDSSTSVFISMAFAVVYSMGFIYLMSAFAEYLAKGLVFLICGGLWFTTFIASYMYTDA